MDAPLGSLATSELGTLLLIAAAFAAVWMRAFPNLRTDYAPRGIVSLQLAFTPRRATAVISSWKRRRLVGAARLSLIVDLAYIASYAPALALTGLLTGRALLSTDAVSQDHAGQIATILFYAALGAGACDLAENAGLCAELRWKPIRLLTLATSIVSSVKWVVALAVLFGSLGLLLWALRCL